MEAVTARPRNNSRIAEDRSSRTPAEPALEFGRFRVLLRQRQLVADGVPIELGTRALDLLLVLLETDGSLVSKDQRSAAASVIPSSRRRSRAGFTSLPSSRARSAALSHPDGTGLRRVFPRRPRPYP
jgi:hypothetical protein